MQSSEHGQSRSTKTTELTAAILMIQYLSDTDRACLLKRQEIADACHLTPSTITRVLARLSQSGLLYSRIGYGGGYRLAKCPSSITYLDVFNIFGKSPALLRCAEENSYQCSDCPGSACALRDVMTDAYNTTVELLRTTSFVR
jgi:Rrf2 family protein